MVTSVNERIAEDGETGESRSRVYSLFRQRKRLWDPVSGGCKRVELTPPSSIGLLNPPPETPRSKDSSTRSGL